MNHTLLIALAIVCSIAAIVAMLILITKRQAKAKKQALWDNYRSLLARHNIVPDVVEEFPHRILALDTARQVFVFVQQDDDRRGEVVLLKDVVECKVSKGGFTSIITGKQGGGRTEEHISTISLLFTLQNGRRMGVPVYTEVLDGIEMRKALQQTTEKWQQTISSVLSRDTSVLLGETA